MTYTAGNTRNKKLNEFRPRPFLKWAGGKSQLLEELNSVKPENFNRYIEPFIGGAAFFFDLTPQSAVISDLNPELVNTYLAVRDDVEAVIATLSFFKNTESDFYKIRERRFEELDSTMAAARTIYLNRTCFNGLYRVNKSGHFNVPYGKNNKAKFIRSETLRAASQALQGTEILLGDYKKVLKENARAGDFIFLDPPYLPASEYADFKRYTKEQFDEEDHAELAAEVKRLQKLGCHVVLTNSNHPLVNELYEGLEITVHNTRRNIRKCRRHLMNKLHIIHQLDIWVQKKNCCPTFKILLTNLSLTQHPICSQDRVL